MPREARVKSKTGIYHIIWRGANRQEIFHDDEDWVKFLDILKKYKMKCKLTVFAWCLMSNHVHLPKGKRKEVLRKVKGIDGLSLRQASRILGIPLTLVFKA